MKKDRNFLSARLHCGGIPRSVPKGTFLWHNHVQHSVGMGHGFNGFRYIRGELPVDYREFMRCRCGVVDLPHYCIRGREQKCVSTEQLLRNAGMTPQSG
jgi:hypothetical protein